MLPNARSFKAEEITREEILAAIALFKVDYKIRHTTAALDEIHDYVTDIFVVDGDLHVAGDLDLRKEGAYLLVVRGNLVVDGAYHDYDDPESFLLVTGDMQARDVITAGWLEVHGDLATGRLLGDYNDCAAVIGGNVCAALFYGEEHHFTIGGELSAGVVIGRPRLDITTEPSYIDLDDPRLLDHLDRALLRAYDDEDDDGNPIVGVDGLKDFRELKRRVSANLPLRTA
jgi:hypothetical protein